MNGPPILIYGNGAMARVACSYLSRSRSVLGFTVDDELIDKASAKLAGRPVHPFSEVQSRVRPDSCEMIIAVGYRDMNALRLQRYEDAKSKGYSFTSYVDPSVIMHDGVEIGENTLILDHTSIHPGVKIGDAVFISSQVSIGHDCVIGDGAWINGGVSLGGRCHVGPQCVFGVNASAAHDVVLGARSFVGANTLVNRAVAPDSVTLSPAGEPFRLKSQDFLSFARMQA
ncbi:MAG: DapH/DapD/GlmU-related protein [Pseudomonadota bacterium]